MNTALVIRNRSYEAGTTVLIDGHRFIGCTFDRCKLVYRGTEELSFESCTFIDCDWSFEGSAENVLAFMGDLYLGLGDQGRLVESLFAAVRKGAVRDAEIPILSDHELSRQRLAS